jgi:hypothetical protein
MSSSKPSKLNRTARVFVIILAAGELLGFEGEIVRDASAGAPTQRFELLEATVPQLQAALTAGTVTSRDLVTMYLARIDAYDQHGPMLNAISVKNGKALAEADAHDSERRAGVSRGPLHGIPIIVKDNYETASIANR